MEWLNVFSYNWSNFRWWSCSNMIDNYELLKIDWFNIYKEKSKLLNKFWNIIKIRPFLFWFVILGALKCKTYLVAGEVPGTGWALICLKLSEVENDRFKKWTSNIGDHEIGEIGCIKTKNGLPIIIITTKKTLISSWINWWSHERIHRYFQ